MSGQEQVIIKELYRLTNLKYTIMNKEQFINKCKTIINRCIKSIQKTLDTDGFEVEYIDDYDFSNSNSRDWIGVFCSELQDNASVFPVSINLDLLYDECIADDTILDDLDYHIEKTLWHEVGHGIFEFCNDILNLDELNEEDVVEEYASWNMNETDDCQLFNILEQATHLDEKLWTTKHIEGTRYNGETYSYDREEYNPQKDSKYQRLIKKQINLLTKDEIKYIYAVRWAIYMQQVNMYNDVSEIMVDVDKNHDEREFDDCYKFLSSLRFPLTIYRGIRVGEYKSSELNSKTKELIISGKQQSLSWTTDINIYKNEKSKFKNITDIVSAEIDSNIIDVANTIFNFMHYSIGRDDLNRTYGEYEITLKNNFKQSDLHNLHFIDKNTVEQLIEQTVYRGVGNKTGIPRYLSNYTGTFYATDKDYASRYGTVSTKELSDELNLYKTETSETAVKELNLNDYQCKDLEEFSYKYITSNEDNENSMFFNWERYCAYVYFSTLSQWENCSEEYLSEYEDDDELICFNEWLRQIVLKNYLSSKGYDGVFYNKEDGVEQLQIWNDKNTITENIDDDIKSLQQQIRDNSIRELELYRELISYISLDTQSDISDLKIDDDIKSKYREYWELKNLDLESKLTELQKQKQQEIDNDNKKSNAPKINDSNFSKFFDKYVGNKTTDEILNVVNIKTTAEIKKSPMFILPDGRLVDVAENVSNWGVDDEEVIHEYLALKISDEFFDKAFNGLEDRDYGSADYAVNFLTDKLGWLRINSGTNSVEDRFYCALPDRDDYRPTTAQYETLTRFFDYGYRHSKDKSVLVFCGKDSVKYSFKIYLSDDIVHKIKRYYAFGILQENFKQNLTEAVEKHNFDNDIHTDVEYEYSYMLICWQGKDWIGDDDKIIRNNIRGYIEFGINDKDEIIIGMIEVAEKYRRQGIATLMMNDLKKRYPDKKIRTTLRTDDGSKFFKKYFNEK